MDGREFSKGSPRFDLTALCKEAKESGLWVPGVLFCHLQPPAVMEETESFLLSADVSRQCLWKGPGKVTSQAAEPVSYPGFLGVCGRESQIFSCVSDRIVLGQQA